MANIFIAFLPLVLLALMEQTLPSPLPLPPSPPQQASCVAELVAFSPCFPYVSDPPNNATDYVAPECCDAFSSAFDSGDGYCFCYILRKPLIFGFPLNKTRVASLSSFCMSQDGSSSDLDSFCSSGVPTLPPLPSTTGSGRLNPSTSGSGNDTSDLMYSPPESDDSLPTLPISSGEPVIVSSATKQNYKHSTWFLHGMIIFCLTTFTSSLRPL